MAKKYNLSKQELGELTKVIGLASMQEELWKSVRTRYRIFVTGTVFKRLGVDQKLFPDCVVNLTTGELIIDKKEKKK